jgi:phage baseplate assembly protein gpV
MNNFTPAVIWHPAREWLGISAARPRRSRHWWSPATRRKVAVDLKIKSRHMANVVLKQAGLPKAF